MEIANMQEAAASHTDDTHQAYDLIFLINYLIYGNTRKVSCCYKY